MRTITICGTTRVGRDGRALDPQTATPAMPRLILLRRFGARESGVGSGVDLIKTGFGRAPVAVFRFQDYATAGAGQFGWRRDQPRGDRAAVCSVGSKSSPTLRRPLDQFVGS